MVGEMSQDRLKMKALRRQQMKLREASRACTAIALSMYIKSTVFERSETA
jgi:hypothetical protein